MSDGRDVCAREGCDNQPPPNQAPGPRRKWCSARCRKAQYAGTCVDCGAPTGGGDGRVAEPRCHPCGMAWRVARGDRADMVAATTRRETITRMLLDGRTNAEIAAELGTTSKTVGETINKMRRAGWDLPYRPGYGPNGRTARREV